jgi:outer membrane scaffolding protein for murein synthesis (MipA/OmpV family)
MTLQYTTRLYSAVPILLTIGILGAAQIVVAASANQQIVDMNKLTQSTPTLVGVGVGFRTSIYKSSNGTFMPNLLLDKGRLFIRGPQFGYRYYASNDWSLDAGIKIETFGDQYDDSPETKAIDGVEGVGKWINANLGAEFKQNAHHVRFDLSHDVSGDHGGSQLALEYLYNFDFPRLKLSPFGGLEWWSREVTDYLFGVSKNSIDASQHEPDSMLHGILGVQMLYWIRPRHALHLRVKHTLLDNTVNDSPLVTTDHLTHSTVTYVYRF